MVNNIVAKKLFKASELQSFKASERRFRQKVKHNTIKGKSVTLFLIQSREIFEKRLNAVGFLVLFLLYFEYTDKILYSLYLSSCHNALFIIGSFEFLVIREFFF